MNTKQPVVALAVSDQAQSGRAGAARDVSRPWGAFDSRAFSRLETFRPDKALPCGPN